MRNMASVFRSECEAAHMMPPAPKLAMKDVLVAADELQPAEPLTREKMRWQSWPQEALNPCTSPVLSGPMQSKC